MTEACQFINVTMIFPSLFILGFFFRIERFWRELWDGCTKTYYEFFWKMEEEGLLDVDNEGHLFVLHAVFLKRIQSSIDQFIDAVARRPLRTEHNKTPLQLWIMGMLEDRHNQEHLSNEVSRNLLMKWNKGLPFLYRTYSAQICITHIYCYLGLYDVISLINIKKLVINMRLCKVNN